jgi:hypothetical protein
MESTWKILFSKNMYDLINWIILFLFQWKYFLFIQPNPPIALYRLSHSSAAVCTLNIRTIRVIVACIQHFFTHHTWRMHLCNDCPTESHTEGIFVMTAWWSKERNWLIIQQWSKFYSIHFVWTCAVGFKHFKTNHCRRTQRLQGTIHPGLWPQFCDNTGPTKMYEYNTAKYSEGADLNIKRQVHQYRCFFNSKQYQSAWRGNILNIKSCMGSYKIIKKATKFVTAAFSHYK